MAEDSQAPIQRRDKDEVATIVASKLTEETQQDIVEWVSRMGLGSLFLYQHPERDFTHEEIGALISIKFDHTKDPMHHDLATTIDEWRRRDEK